MIKSNRLVGTVLLLLFVGLVMFVVPEGVFAHASLVRAEPAPGSVLPDSPQRVTLWFTEPIEPRFSDIRVLDSTATRVDNGDSAIVRGDPKAMSVSLRSLGPGLYTVAWRNVSAIDGHALRDSFTFTVGRISLPTLGGATTPSQQVPPDRPLFQSPLEPILRWISLLSAIALVGGLGFYLLVVGHILRSYKKIGDRLAGRILVVQRVATGMLVAMEAVKLVIQTSTLYEIPVSQALGAPIFRVLSGTEWGRFWVLRIALLALMVAIMQGGARLLRRGLEKDTGWWVSLGIAAVVLLTFSLASHDAALTDLRIAGTVTDYLHLLAAAFWVGGLFHFALGMPVFQPLRPKDRGVMLQTIVPRFSTLAILSVGTLIITGLYSVWAMVGTLIPAYTQTAYGLSLVAKIALVALLSVLGALNLMWVRPRLAQVPPKDPATEGWLRRLVLGEVILAVLVLLTVGFLASLEPARQVAAREGLGQQQAQSLHAVAGDKHIIIRVEPGRVGLNRFLVSVSDLRGNPVNDADVTMRLFYTGADLGAADLTALPLGGGQYLVAKGQLGIAGSWRLELTIRSRGSFDTRAAFRFDIDTSPTDGSAVVSPTIGRLLFGVELVLLGLLFQIAGRRLGSWRSRAGAVAMSMGTATAVLGLILMASVVLGGRGGPQAAGNSLPALEQSISISKQLYTERVVGPAP